MSAPTLSPKTLAGQFFEPRYEVWDTKNSQDRKLTGEQVLTYPEGVEGITEAFRMLDRSGAGDAETWRGITQQLDRAIANWNETNVGQTFVPSVFDALHDRPAQTEKVQFNRTQSYLFEESVGTALGEIRALANAIAGGLVRKQAGGRQLAVTQPEDEE